MNKKLKITIAVGLAILLLAAIYFLVSGPKNTKTGSNNDVPKDVPAEMLETQTPEAAKATQELVNEVANIDAGKVETINVGSPVSIDGQSTSTGTVIKAVTVTPGTNPINVASGKVITKTGEVVANSAVSGTLNAPQVSYVLTDTSSLPKSAIKIEVTSNSFAPKEFTVNRGQAVSLVVSNVNDTTLTERFVFDDPSLQAIILTVPHSSSKSISFNAPDKAGTYTFYSNMFNHRELGAVGAMIVK